MRGRFSPHPGRWSAAVPRPERCRALLAMLLQENTCGYLQIAIRFFLIKALDNKKQRSLLSLFGDYPSVKHIDFSANSSHALKCLKNWTHHEIEKSH